jgi:hypothetical protein
MAGVHCTVSGSGSGPGHGDGHPGIQVAVAFGENHRETEQPRMNGHLERTPEPYEGP